MKYLLKRTDLALELAPAKSLFALKKRYDHVKTTSIKLDSVLSKKLGKAKGKYITIESRAVVDMRDDQFEDVSEALARELKKFCALATNILVVGLGNPNMTADSLGSVVASKLMVTRHMPKEAARVSLSVITPNVLGVTGIESFDVISGVCDKVKPDVIIVVDSLASAAVSRIACAFQLSDAGITPGSGVSNHRARLDKSSLGATVISVGVPLVVYASTIIEDALGECAQYNKDIGDMIVTPKDIDLYVENCARIIANAINLLVC